MLFNEPGCIAAMKRQLRRTLVQQQGVQL